MLILCALITFLPADSSWLNPAMWSHKVAYIGQLGNSQGATDPSELATFDSNGYFTGLQSLSLSGAYSIASNQNILVGFSRELGLIEQSKLGTDRPISRNDTRINWRARGALVSELSLRATNGRGVCPSGESFIDYQLEIIATSSIELTPGVTIGGNGDVSLVINPTACLTYGDLPSIQGDSDSPISLSSYVPFQEGNMPQKSTTRPCIIELDRHPFMDVLSGRVINPQGEYSIAIVAVAGSIVCAPSDLFSEEFSLQINALAPGIYVLLVLSVDGDVITSKRVFK
jgi:hypothetical protein